VGSSTAQKSLGDGGAFVRKILAGFWRPSMLDPLVDLNFLGGRNWIGSMFSDWESSKEAALRLVGAEKVEITVGLESDSLFRERQ
jgi:hypothetical protein